MILHSINPALPSAQMERVMKATFKPTNYTFTLEDKYFVQAQKADGSQPFLGAFADFWDARDFADALQRRGSINAVYIFTREQQHYSWHRPSDQRLAA